MNRQHLIERKTDETDISLRLNLDGGGLAEVDTGVPFFDHMLAQWTKHSGFDLHLKACGDLKVDAHHTLEDCGIALGQALAGCLHNRADIARFGYAYAPLDEALARVVLDISGRPSLQYHARFTQTMVGALEVDLIRECLQGFVNHAGVTLHVDLLRGVNGHHQLEAIFKAFALAAAQATQTIQGRGIPSTKGVL